MEERHRGSLYSTLLNLTLPRRSERKGNLHEIKQQTIRDQTDPSAQDAGDERAIKLRVVFDKFSGFENEKQLLTELKAYRSPQKSAGYRDCVHKA